MPLTYAAREAFKAVEQKQLVYVASLSQPGNLAEQRINRLVRQSMNHGASVLIRFKIEKMGIPKSIMKKVIGLLFVAALAVSVPYKAIAGGYSDSPSCSGKHAVRPLRPSFFGLQRHYRTLHSIRWRAVVRSLIVTLPGSAFDIPADPISPIAGLFPDPVFPPMATRYSSVAFLRGMNSPGSRADLDKEWFRTETRRNTFLSRAIRRVVSLVLPGYAHSARLLHPSNPIRRCPNPASFRRKLSPAMRAGAVNPPTAGRPHEAAIA